jgi:hypothetical protein
MKIAGAQRQSHVDVVAQIGLDRIEIGHAGAPVCLVRRGDELHLRLPPSEAERPVPIGNGTR